MSDDLPKDSFDARDEEMVQQVLEECLHAEMMAVTEAVITRTMAEYEVASDDDAIAVIEPARVAAETFTEGYAQQLPAGYAQCAVCNQPHNKGLHIVDMFMCATCAEEIVHTPVENARYPHYVSQMRKAWFRGAAL
jgi:hypothetical protein